MYVVSDVVLDVVPPATLVLMRYVIALPVLWIGLSLSALGPVDQALYPAVQAGQPTYCSSPKFQEDGRYSCPADNSLEGNSLVYLGMKYLRFGQLLPAPEDYKGQSLFLYWIRYFFTGGPIPLGGRDVFIDPVAFAGWAGLLVTALNPKIGYDNAPF